MTRIVHFELAVDDPDRAIAFYENVLGWKTQKWDGPVDYWLLITGEESEPGIHGALMRRQDNWPDVINTANVADLEAAVAAAEANGGTRVTPRTTVSGVGYMSYITDSEGNMLGLMQGDPNAQPES